MAHSCGSAHLPLPLWAWLSKTEPPAAFSAMGGGCNGPSPRAKISVAAPATMATWMARRLRRTCFRQWRVKDCMGRGQVYRSALLCRKGIICGRDAIKDVGCRHCFPMGKGRYGTGSLHVDRSPRPRPLGKLLLSAAPAGNDYISSAQDAMVCRHGATRHRRRGRNMALLNVLANMTAAVANIDLGGARQDYPARGSVTGYSGSTKQLTRSRWVSSISSIKPICLRAWGRFCLAAGSRAP